MRHSPHRAGMAVFLPLAGMAATLILFLPTGGASADLVGGQAVEILPPSNAGPDPLASLQAVSCPRAGTCVGGGLYTDNQGIFLPMVAAQSHGRWARAIELQLPRDASARSEGEVNALACPGAGSCVAVGGYDEGGAARRGYVAVESRGRWGRSAQIKLPPNAAALPAAGLVGVSCEGSISSCTAAGSYIDRSGRIEGMTVSETTGHWGRARESAAPADAAANPELTWNAIACPATGSCVVAGSYRNRAGFFTGAVATEIRGHWQRATRARLPSNSATNPDAAIDSVACPSPGSCVITGFYLDASARLETMAGTLAGGRWQLAVEITAPQDAAANPDDALVSVSCTGPSVCSAVGHYDNAAAHFAAMRTDLVSGRWRMAALVQPPVNASTAPIQRSFLFSNVCVRSWSCVAVGTYMDNAGDDQAMAVTLPLP